MHALDMARGQITRQTRMQAMQEQGKSSSEIASATKSEMQAQSDLRAQRMRTRGVDEDRIAESIQYETLLQREIDELQSRGLGAKAMQESIQDWAQEHASSAGAANAGDAQAAASAAATTQLRAMVADVEGAKRGGIEGELTPDTFHDNAWPTLSDGLIGKVRHLRQLLLKSTPPPPASSSHSGSHSLCCRAAVLPCCRAAVLPCSCSCSAPSPLALGTHAVGCSQIRQGGARAEREHAGSEQGHRFCLRAGCGLHGPGGDELL
jgi:hypothetical protein